MAKRSRLGKSENEGLDLFMEYMDEESVLSSAVERATHKGGRRELKDKAMKKIREMTYTTAVEYGDIDESEIKSPKELDTPKRNDFALNYVKAMAIEALEDASGLMNSESKLEKILSQLSDKGIDKVLRNEENYKLIAGMAGEEYTEWRGIYEAYQSAQDLAKRAKKGKEALSSDERKEIKQVAMRVAADESREALRELYSEETAEMGAQLSAEAVALGLRKIDYAGIAKKSAVEIEKALKEYEEKSGKNLRSYFEAGIQKLAKVSDDGFDKGREMIYIAGKQK